MERILIVDDDPGFKNLLETILVGEGYGVESAGSVGEALRAGARPETTPCKRWKRRTSAMPSWRRRLSRLSP